MIRDWLHKLRPMIRNGYNATYNKFVTVYLVVFDKDIRDKFSKEKNHDIDTYYIPLRPSVINCKLFVCTVILGPLIVRLHCNPNGNDSAPSDSPRFLLHPDSNLNIPSMNGINAFHSKEQREEILSFKYGTYDLGLEIVARSNRNPVSNGDVIRNYARDINILPQARVVLDNGKLNFPNHESIYLITADNITLHLLRVRKGKRISIVAVISNATSNGGTLRMWLEYCDSSLVVTNYTSHIRKNFNFRSIPYLDEILAILQPHIAEFGSTHETLAKGGFIK